MSRLRVLVLLLLCALLPLRGVVAATMVCTESGPSSQTMTAPAQIHAHAHAHAHHDMHGERAGPGPGSHPVQTGAGSADAVDADADEAAQGDRCHFCASGCHAVPLITMLPSAPGAMPVATAAFPVLVVPAPVFQSGGQDRPPRTI
ncbi:hypothetical protein [Ideonella sp.]|uniref:hypothetical protein n=1 Tax=Ideonella sp. TaxID=1929293 RepID=UPI003BB5A8B2